jgi:hypothetical protein
VEPDPRDPLVMFSDRLPPGSFPEEFVGVLGYLDPNGQMCYCVIHAGNATLSTFLGLLRLGEHRLIEHFEAGQEGP